MYSSKQNVCQLVALLKAHGISRFVVSPGSRHIPIVISMEADMFFHLYSVVDERSASFFAIGLMQRFKEPVGIICTSGTASANYCSAINECLYQELPLLVLTADRQESLRDQHEDQMIRQSTMYKPIAKMVTNLVVVHDKNDLWFNNRLINEALLELRHHGNGPVQINIPVPEHTDDFNTLELPCERKIDRWELDTVNWPSVAERLTGRKVMIVCGEGYALTNEQTETLDHFCKKYDAIVLCDKMSNCHIDNSIQNTFPMLNALNAADVSALAPDIILTIRANFSFNPELKGVVSRMLGNGKKIANWFVHPSGRIVDTYKGILTDVFEMDEFTFFHHLADTNTATQEQQEYAELWKVISSAIDEPSSEFCQVDAAGRFMRNIPAGSILQIANSNSVRVAQLYQIDPSIECHCNRGTDGIDGCMSTAVGFASETDQLLFLMIGDLTFFYDMNALWNRHIHKNLRIFLTNNGGGAIMHMPKRPDFAAEHLPNFISARHNASAKGWAEDRGFIYLSAKSEEELEKGIAQLTSKEADRPVILEVFTDMLEDTRLFKQYYATINRAKLDRSLLTRSKRVVKAVCAVLGINPADLKKFVGGGNF